MKKEIKEVEKEIFKLLLIFISNVVNVLHVSIKIEIEESQPICWEELCSFTEM